MKMTRKHFLGTLGSGTVVLWLQGCGGGGGGGGGYSGGAGGSGGMQQCGASGTSISGNHGHSLSIAAADLNSASDMTYSIMGTADHSHNVTFTVAQLGLLKSGQSVVVESTLTSSHSHTITARCV